jgi:glutathione S-transferase
MKLYGYHNGRTLRAAWALEEANVKYDYVEIAVLKGEARKKWFLEINPAGKVPVLEVDDHFIAESAAICLYIADARPEACLLPPTGSVERAKCYQWLSFAIAELEQPMWTVAKHTFRLPIGLPLDKRLPAILETARWEFESAAAVLEANLQHYPYVAGTEFSVADIVVGHTLSWARSVKSARFDLSPVLASYAERVLSRTAARSAQARLQQNRNDVPA